MVHKWTNCIQSYFTEGLQGQEEGSIKSPRKSNICVAYIYSAEFNSMHSSQMFLPIFMLSLSYFFTFFVVISISRFFRSGFLQNFLR